MDAEELKEKLEEVHLSGYGWAVSCCRGERQDAEEVLQTVYLKILQGKAVWRGESSFKTWFFAVIRKTAIDYRRRAWFRSVLHLRQSARLEVENREWFEDIEQAEKRQFFLDSLKKLPRRQREVLHLVFYNESSLREAAEVLNISVGSARRHYERGKKNLRNSLEKNEIYETEWRGKETRSIVS